MKPRIEIHHFFLGWQWILFDKHNRKVLWMPKHPYKNKRTAIQSALKIQRLMAEAEVSK